MKVHLPFPTIFLSPFPEGLSLQFSVYLSGSSSVRCISFLLYINI